MSWTPAPFLDVRSSRLAGFIVRHPKWTMPIVVMLLRIKYRRWHL